jgi:FkbM family methyltransferase
MRSLVERSTGGWRFRRRMPKAFGRRPIFVTPSAGLKYLFKPMHRTDDALLRNAAELIEPGQTVWDIGANIGLFTIAAAFRVGAAGKVLALEPDTWLVELLRRSAAAQPPMSGEITIIPAAAVGEVSVRDFSIARRARAANALSGHGGSQMGGVAEMQKVVCLSLDWLLTRTFAPDLVKIDVEGAELEVLDGAREILSTIRPTILCEVNEPNIAGVTTRLLQADYALYDGDRPAASSGPIDRACWNTLALPREKVPST